jgi:hypothetical protein
MLEISANSPKFTANQGSGQSGRKAHGCAAPQVF